MSSSETVSPIKPPDFVGRFDQTGELFSYLPTTNLFSVAAGGVAAYASPFSFSIGATSTNMLFVKEDGVVSFGQSLASGGFVAVSDLARLAVPLIAPFYADLNQNSRTASAANFAGVVIQQGLADPFADAAGAFALADAKDAVRITWYGFDTAGTAAAGGAPVFVQLLLIDEGGGDFDFKIRAGAPGSAAANSPAGGIGGFVLGTSNYQFATPYDATSAGTFSVRGGDIVALAPAVPEPASWALLTLGFGLIGAALRRPAARRTGRARYRVEPVAA